MPKAVATPASTSSHARRGGQTPPPTVSGRWLLTAATLSIVGAGFCAWGALCLLFWQGSWQLLYHPASAVTRAPASVGLAFDPVAFATTEAAEPRLKGWWIAAEPGARYARFTVLYLHGQDGNLSDAVDALTALHQAGLNVFAFDYRGYGQSEFQRPSEARWREDADWAIKYLTGTRHVAADTIILDGRALGANLALEVAAAHPELAGVVLESPLEAPMNAVFNDPRAHMVPAHLLVRDRFDADQAAADLRIPSLWFESAEGAHTQAGDAVKRVSAPKMLVWLKAGPEENQERTDSLARWLDDLAPGSLKPRN
ncbi:MAG: alpha/beta fold hydrolase [Terracidiphilus sp.]